MRKFLTTLSLAIVIFGCGWALWNKDKIDSPESFFSLLQSQFDELTEDSFTSPNSNPNAQLAGWTQPSQSTIRIAAFNIQIFGQKKIANETVTKRLVEICQQFDVIAIQEIRSRDQSVLPRFIRQLNASGRDYGFVISPRVGRSKSKEQAAFIFDQSRIQLDHSLSYTINDPDDVLRREPFVGWFRTRGPRLDEAFTFTLANVHMDARRPDLELVYVTELHRIIRKDGRGEDDVILLGDFNAGDRGLEPAARRGGLTWVVSNTPTNTRNTNQYDNIVFDGKATDEYLGIGGVYDFMTEMNLTFEEALAISDHKPVWAEFSIYEGGQPKRVAENQNGHIR